MKYVMWSWNMLWVDEICEGEICYVKMKYVMWNIIILCEDEICCVNMKYVMWRWSVLSKEEMCYVKMKCVMRRWIILLEYELCEHELFFEEVLCYVKMAYATWVAGDTCQFDWSSTPTVSVLRQSALIWVCVTRFWPLEIIRHFMNPP